MVFFMLMAKMQHWLVILIATRGEIKMREKALPDMFSTFVQLFLGPHRSRKLWPCLHATRYVAATSVLNGGHNDQENLSGIGIYQGYIGDIFKNRMSKSDCKYTYIFYLKSHLNKTIYT